MFIQVFKVASVLISLSILISCSESTPINTEETLIRPAKIFIVEDPSTKILRNFPAEVEANTDSQLAFRVGGQITEFTIKAGNEVRKGDILAKLDSKDFELQLDDRQARYNLAQSKFDRAKLLLEKQLGSQSGFDEAKANLDVARSSLNVAKSNVEYTLLRAPFSGTVSHVYFEKFDHIQPKQPILDLQTNDLIDISIQIPESIASRTNKNTRYQPTVIFDSHPQEEFLATVKEWDTQADPSTLTYKVVFSLPNPSAFNVLPGMSANVRIDLSQVTTLNLTKYILPISAVFSAEDQPLKNNKKFVWKVNPATMKVNRIEVNVGDIKSNGIEILSGLTAGDQVVAAGSHFLTENMEIRPWNREKGL